MTVPSSAIPPLANGQCQVWWTNPAPQHEVLASLLDAAEQERRARFRAMEDRARYLATHALARLVLAAHAGIPAQDLRFTNVCRHCGALHGKPQLSEGSGSLDFSLAHSGERVVVAVARGAVVGVDVEHLRPLRNGAWLARKLLSPDEWPAFDALPEAAHDAALFRYWTRKEALLKATGHGIAVRTSTITVTGPTQPPALIAWTDERQLDETVALHDLDPGADHIACLAMLGGRLAVTEFDAGALFAQAAADQS
jgi:4'-phosphopantetheinyl transferase